MQRLQDELPLSSEALESVFDSLDDDGNGFLTLEEFTDGFGELFISLTFLFTLNNWVLFPEIYNLVFWSCFL